MIRAIPAGQVMGYGQVAMRAGLPGRARLTARILGGLLKTGGLRKRYKWYMSSLIAGTTAWTTHFVAMLAYDPGVPHGYDAGLTAKSLLVSLAGMVLAIGLFSHGRL